MLHCLFKLKNVTTKSEKKAFSKHLMYTKTYKTNFTQEFSFHQVILANLEKVLIFEHFSQFKKGILEFALHLQSPEVFQKRVVLKNLTIFTGKHLCWDCFLIKL